MKCSIVKFKEFAGDCRGKLLYIILRDVLFSPMLFDVLQCFCNDSALYLMHLYELRKDVSTAEIAQSSLDRMGAEESTGLAVSSGQLSIQMLKYGKSILKKKPTLILFPKRRKITLKP